MRRSTAFLVLLAPLVVASGASETKRRSSTSKQVSSARFFQVHAGTAGESENPVATHEVVEGAFDWRDRTGWAVQRYANGSVFWRQVDGACFEWADESVEGPGSSEPMKIEDGCGLPATAHDPRTALSVIRKSAVLEKVGTADLDGVPTTRFRAIWKSEEKREKYDPVDLWVDKADVVRRLRFGRQPSYVTIEYFDFGVDAAAEWESPNNPPRWTPDQRTEDVSQ